MTVLNSILLLLFVYLGGSTLYYLLFTTVSLIPRRIKRFHPTRHRKVAILIPGYKEDAVIVDVARDALKQDYPQDRFDVVVIADTFSDETLASLRQLPIKVVEVSFEKSTKSRALNKAMEVLEDDYDIALVLDADNLMAADCLARMNECIESGFKAVQGHRVAKNLNTSFAILDAISEEIANNTFRNGQRVLGLSSGLAGSGMAFDFTYFKDVMRDIDAVGGFDKELELAIMAQGDSIEYLKDVYIYDEKVQKAEVFYNQRRRWISSQWRNLFNYAGKAVVKLLTKGNINYFNKVFQWVFPPRTIYIGALSIVAFSVAIFYPDPSIKLAWMLLWVAGVFSFIFGIPRFFYNKDTLQALMSLPKAFLLMFKALLQIKGSNKTFIHTEHTSVNAEEVKRLHESKVR